MGQAPQRAMLRVTNSASPREERIKVRSERFNSRHNDGPCASALMLKIIFVIFTLLVARTFATAGEILPRDPDYDYEPPAPGSYSLPVVKVAPDGALLDSNGKSLSLRDLTHGRVTVLSFIYTRCAAPKACPYATGVLNQIHDLSVDDKTLAKNMRLISISFDPEYDTPQRLAAYSENVREQGSGCEWRFVTL